MKRLLIPTRLIRCILPLAVGLLPSLAFAQVDPARLASDPYRPVQLLGIGYVEPAAGETDAKESEGEESDKDAKAEDDSAKVIEDLKKRLEKLEESWDEQQEAEAKAKAKKAKEPTFEIGGRIHLDTWSFLNDSEGIHWFENPDTGVDPENRVVFRRIRLEIQGDVFETMLYRLQVDFNEPANPEIKDVYIGWDELPGNHTVIFGNHKRPLGLDHLNSSRFNIFAERPLVIEAFNEDSRRLGLSAIGHTDDEVNHWQFGLYHLENVAESGRIISDSRQVSGNARFWSSPWYDESSDGRGYFHWAVAGMIARPDGDVDPNDSNDNLGRFRTRSEVRSDSRWLDTGPVPGAEWYEIGGLEAMLNIGSLQVVGEYQHTWMQRGPSRYGTGPDLNFHGGYVYAAWFLTGEHVPYDRESGTVDRVRPFENFFLVERCRGGCGGGWGAWQLKARWSYLDLTDHDIEGGAGQNVTVGLNWWWTSHSRLQVDLTRGEVENHRPIAGFTSGDFWALGTRAMVDF